jgi:outer membrane protein
MSSVARHKPTRLAAALGVATWAALAIAAAPAGAQRPAPAPSPSTPITLADAVQIALRQNVTIRQARNSAEQSATDVRQARMQFVPNLSLSTNTSTNVGRNFNQNEGRIINQTSQSVSAGVSSGVTLFDGFRNVANLRSAQASETATEQTMERTRQTVVFTVASNFLTLVTNQEQLRVQEQNLVAQEALQGQVERFVSAGVRAISDLYQQQAAVASARLAVLQARQALELAKVDLMQTLQLEPSASYDFVPPALGDTATISGDSIPGLPRYELDSLLAQAMARRSDLSAQLSRLEAAEQAIRSARGGRLPSVSMNFNYNSAYTNANELGFLDQFDQRRGGSVGVGLSLPIFDRGNASIATQQAELQLENARLTLEQQRQTVALEVRRALLDYEAAQEQLVAAAAQQRAADLAVATVQERYRVGAATLVEVTQSRASQVQAASAYINARYNLVFQQSLMSYYTGALDPSRAPLPG